MNVSPLGVIRRPVVGDSREWSEIYAKGARMGTHEAVPVADRWHLLMNVGDPLAIAALERGLSMAAYIPLPELPDLAAGLLCDEALVQRHDQPALEQWPDRGPGQPARDVQAPDVWRASISLLRQRVLHVA